MTAKTLNIRKHSIRLALCSMMMLCAENTFAAKMLITNLNDYSPTQSHSKGAIANTAFTDDALDNDAVVDDNADITLAFETSLLTQAPAAERVFFEFGGTGGGLSLTWLPEDGGLLALQTIDDDDLSKLGGVTASGTSAALTYPVQATDIGHEIRLAVSLDTDSTNSTLRLFIDDLMVAEAVGDPTGDWAGGDTGGFFVKGGGSMINSLFVDADLSGPTTNEATANSSLRLYEDIVADDSHGLSILSFEATSHRIPPGHPLTLSWETSHAETLSISEIGSVDALTTNGVGQITVTPTNTTSYTIFATGSAGTIDKTLGVRVVGADARPNIILFYVDDMGWQDTSVEFHTEQTIYNRRYITPAMETLASRGTIFTQAYSPATICGPSRYALISGILPARSHSTYNGTGSISDTIIPPSNSDVVPVQNLSTLPRSLNDLGYRTIEVGKWHLGNPASVHASGFDERIGGHEKGQPGSYYGTANYGSGVYQVPDLEAYHGQDVFLSEALTLEANKALERAVDDGKPFFLFMSHYAVHTPIQIDPRFTQNYDGIEDGDHYISDSQEIKYATLVEGMDKSLGDIMAKLEAMGVAEDTLIVFSSDHGGLTMDNVRRGATAYPDFFPEPSYQAHNWPLRYGKGWTYEGGIRVPFIISWAKPNAGNPYQMIQPIDSGGSENRMVSQLDLFPTLVKQAGGTPPAGLDGYDIAGYFTAGAETQRPTRYIWHQPHWRADHNIPHSTAFRLNDHKLIYWYENGDWGLYNLSSDLSETNNLAAVETNTLIRMAREMVRELDDVKALFPTWVSNGEEIHPVPPQFPDLDLDHDGIKDQTEDPNHNGLIDPGETDPNSYDNFEALELRVEADTGGINVSFKQPAGPPADISFTLESTESLAPAYWQPFGLPSSIINTGDGHEYISHMAIPSSSSALFRVRIEHNW